MRYLPHTEADRRAMLEVIGVARIEDFFRDVPEAARLEAPLDLPKASGEIEVERALSRLAAKNLPAGSVPSFLGAGVYRHPVPAAVDYLVERGEFLTSYTPYQPEIAQGTLQALFEFQTQVALITDMEVANASLYDGATATAEAVMMSHRLTHRKKAILAGNLHPHYRETTATYARFNGFEILAREPDPADREDLGELVDSETSCVVVQNPGFFGQVRDYTALAAACHRAGALLVVVVTEVVSLGLVQPPGAMGADIVAAEGQSIGNALNFGGPHLGLFATREKFVRQVPGRLCGQTVDAEGRRGFVLHTRASGTAYPARKSDQQHLHQFGALRPRLRHTHGASGRGRFHPARCAQPRARRDARRCSRRDPRRKPRQRFVLQRIHLAIAAAGRPDCRGTRAARRSRRRARQPAVAGPPGTRRPASRSYDRSQYG